MDLKGIKKLTLSQINNEMDKIRTSFDKIEKILCLSVQFSEQYLEYMDKVEQIVIEIYGISLEDLLGGDRTDKSVAARNLCGEIRKKNKETFKSIGAKYGRSEHTIMNNLKVHRRNLEVKDKEYCKPYNQAMARIKLLKQ